MIHNSLWLHIVEQDVVAQTLVKTLGDSTTIVDHTSEVVDNLVRGLLIFVDQGLELDKATLDNFLSKVGTTLKELKEKTQIYWGSKSLTDDDLNDPAEESLDDSHADSDPHELIDEPLVDESSPSTDEIDAEHESTDAGPYADLYDPRAQRNPPEEADSAPSNEPGEPPSA